MTEDQIRLPTHPHALCREDQEAGMGCEGEREMPHLSSMADWRWLTETETATVYRRPHPN